MLRAALILAMLGTACSAVAANPAAETPLDEAPVAGGLRGLPADARAVAERLASCTHFMGEFNGDRSQRDREVSATLAELECDHIEADVARIRTTYRHDAAVQQALADATAP